MIRAQFLGWALLAAQSFYSVPAMAQQLSPEAEVLMRSAKAQGIAMTPQQAEQLAARQKQILSTLGALGTFPTAATIQPTVAPAGNEASLLRQINVLRKAAGPATMEGSAISLKIGGRPFVDPEGQLANVAFDPANGDSSFLVGRSNVRQLKFLSAHAVDSPLNVGIIIASGDNIEFTGIAGAHMVGSRFTVLPDGVALWRDEAMFIYRYGQRVESFALPEGFYPAEYQRGNVGTTGLVLVRKDDRGKSNNDRAVKAMGSLLGMVSGKKQSDFALLDFRSGRQIPLPLENITQDGDELTNSIGRANNHHYFWRASWGNLGKRRFAIYYSKGVQDLSVTDLDSGTTRLAMSRGLASMAFRWCQMAMAAVDLSQTGYSRIMKFLI